MSADDHGQVANAKRREGVDAFECVPLVVRPQPSHVVVTQAMAQEQRPGDCLQAARHGERREVSEAPGLEVSCPVRHREASHLLREKPPFVVSSYRERGGSFE